MKRKASAARNRLAAWRSRAGRDASLPVTDTFLLEMADDETLLVKGSRAIADYAPDRIAFQTDRFLLTVEGTGLFLREYGAAEAVVGGVIGSVNFGRDPS